MAAFRVPAHRVPARLMPACRTPRGFFRDERGLTTTSVAVSLLLAIALVFSSAQVYRLNSLSAEVQEVADAAALAAENQVAKFMLIARTCDAVVLTLSLTSIVVTGLGAAAACVPAGATVSEKLISAGRDIIKARDNFADSAASGLNRAMKFLPLISAAQAMYVAQANNVSEGSNYLAIAILVQQEGKEITFDVDDAAQTLSDDVSAQSDEVREKAQQAEDAANEANEAKLRGFNRDCGDNPGYCMYERASKLSGLSGSQNPLYSSVDAWSFSVALERARAYYAQRLAVEAPADSSVGESKRSALRKRFYAYAVSEMRSAYVHETDDSFEAYFPHLPRNTNEMRQTWLYTETAYPISTNDEGSSVMHAWSGCPGIDSIVAWGSAADLDAGGFATCPVCEFAASDLGSVASASTSIDNGFEYHYEAMAKAAEDYQVAREKLDPLTSDVKGTVSGWFEDLANAVKKAANKRLEVEPPGAYGAIAFVVNVGSTQTDSAFSSGFVNASYTLGTRVAISAATLVDEGSDEGESAVSSLLDTFSENGSVLASGLGVVLDCWSGLLSAYGQGQESLFSTVESGLNSLPLVGKSGLGTWAAKKLRSVVEGVGLEPAEIGALKPVLVNSGHVASKGDSSFAQAYLSAKRTVSSHALASTDLFSSVLTDAERSAINAVDSLGSSVQIASVQLLGSSGPSVDITLPLPEGVRNTATSFIEGAFDRIQSLYANVVEETPWE